MTASTREQGREGGPVALARLSWAVDTPVCAGCRGGLGREGGLAGSTTPPSATWKQAEREAAHMF